MPSFAGLWDQVECFTLPFASIAAENPLKPMKYIACTIVALMAAPALFAAGDPFAEGVRTTDPLTPDQQQKTFNLPPGFKVQLVAAEPELRKPMNMAFDGAGRLWITESREYPWPTNAATRDTHGNQASFRRGLDGWIYATHGFNNRSKVAGKDGHEVFFPSGNTYRFRTDGWRIEHWTHGQVNPFGLTFDALGNLYSADCHSSPIYQLLRGGWYPSFGAPDDGLGFAPTTIQHTHGSTAICGITVLDDPSWPEEFRDNLIIGNVMPSRINRDSVEWRGSTSVGHEMSDLVSVTDPW